ncbi:MAG TPA: hypothetical protein VN442_14780 [Bryobacteraceae bacterium]|nr:hypothetical protein [Bryobacteraceae bacterium]
MVVRIRFGQGPKVERKGRKNRRAALAMGALLTPAAVMAAALGAWRLAADLKWTESFAIPQGLFSHWQVWFASAGMLQVFSRVLYHYGKGGDRSASGDKAVS